MNPIVAQVPRTRIVVSGEDAASFLQGQLSQDLDQLSTGDATWSYLLTPPGKAIALLRIWKESDVDYSVLVEPEVGEKVLDRLQTFLFRAKASISSEETSIWCVRGANAEGFDCGWPGVNGNDSIDKPIGDFDEVAFEQWETFRIGAGVPSNENELKEERIPQELSFDQAISFTKGCYVGQELVSRINSRGRVTKRLCGLVFDEGVAIPEDANDYGEITSISPSAVDGKLWALAFVRHDVEYGTELISGDSGLKARVAELPLLNFA